MAMNYPLTLKFKKIAISQQVTVTDVQGNVVLYVKQKAFKLKEDVSVYADVQQTRLLYTIKADRIIDFNARYAFTDAQGKALGAMKRQGVKSLVKSHYDVFDAQSPDTARLSVTEENPWIKVVDALVSEIPVVGMFTGYLLHPSYLMTRTSGTPVLRLKKEPALFESSFSIQKLADNFEPPEETNALLALMLMVLLVRHRG